MGKETPMHSKKRVFSVCTALCQVGTFTPVSRNGLEFFINRFPMQF